MSDRELLELAAKALGTELLLLGTKWDPLNDDGYALRLAVLLGLHATQYPILDCGFDAPLGMVEVWRVDDDDPMHVEYLRSGDDRLVATRRAIVRAAAELGRAMP